MPIVNMSEYEVHIYSIFGKFKQMMNWCLSNNINVDYRGIYKEKESSMGKEYKRIFTGTAFIFESETDAMAFKLMWGGE
jgi:hypothetical protein